MSAQMIDSPSHPSCAVTLTHNKTGVLQLYESAVAVFWGERKCPFKWGVKCLPSLQREPWNKHVSVFDILGSTDVLLADRFPLTLFGTVTFPGPEHRFSPAPGLIWVGYEFSGSTLIGRRWLLSERVLKTRLVTLDWRLLLPRQPYLMR